MFFKLLLLFITIPFLEMVILIKLGAEWGFVPTLLLIVVTGIVGAALSRWQGLKAWREIQLQLNQGLMPGEALIDGLLIFGAGMVLLTPGLLTDTLGFLLLIPQTRQFFKAWLRKKFAQMQARPHEGMTIFLD